MLTAIGGGRESEGLAELADEMTVVIEPALGGDIGDFGRGGGQNLAGLVESSPYQYC
ncbi:MAG: hypothetical protein WCI20_06775 [bacterium]